MRARICAALVTVLAAGACAVPEPPPGGPVDEKAPSVVGTSPENGTTGVAPDAQIALMFDEPMTQTRVERYVTLYPRIVVGKTRWKKEAFFLTPDEPLHADTTYVVELGRGLADAHGVKTADVYQFGFATSAVIDSGVIAGHVLFRRQPSKAAIVRLFVLPKDTSFAPEATFPDRQANVDGEGAFRLAYLPTDDKTFMLWSFQDTDGNGSFTVDRDVVAEKPDTVKLSPTSPALDDVNVVIVDPTEPAEVVGQIVSSMGFDSVAVMVTMDEVEDTLPPTYVTRAAPPDGNFRFGTVLKGRYTLHTFIDFGPDSLCGSYPCGEDSTDVCFEPCATYPDTIRVNPGDKINLGELILETPLRREE